MPAGFAQTSTIISWGRSKHDAGSGHEGFDRRLPAAYRAAIPRGGISVGDGTLGTKWSSLVECTSALRYSKRAHRCTVHVHPLAVAGQKPSSLASVFWLTQP